MKWTEQHDIYLCRELLLLKPYQFKPGTKESGAAWTSVATDLNVVKEISFTVNQKSVRDRTKLLLDKFKRRMREEENSSGTVQEETEIDQLLADIKSESDEAAERYESMNTNKQKEIEKAKENAESIRLLAMENLSDTQKRKIVDDNSPISHKRRNSGSETLTFLMAKLESDKELKKQELEMKKQSIERDLQQQNIFNQLLEQQRQMNINQQQQNQLVLQLIGAIVTKSNLDNKE